MQSEEQPLTLARVQPSSSIYTSHSSTIKTKDWATAAWITKIYERKVKFL